MSWAVGDIWQLLRGEDLVGEIVIEDGDWPWLSGRFRPQPVFAEVKPWFDEELALVESDLDVQKWEDVYSRITGSLSLMAPHGLVPEFLLHIEGDQAWFRWSDEPFDDDA